MTTEKNMLELFSFEITEQSFNEEVFYYIQMPIAWERYFESKRMVKNGYQDYKMTIKPRNMETYIYGMFPNVFHISWKQNPWLLTSEKIDLGLLKEVCLSWFAKQEKCLVSELPIELLQVDLNQVLTTFSEYKQNHSDTNIMYRWIPSLMAKRTEINYQGESLPFLQEQNIRFRHLYFNGQHECMSTLIQSSEKQDPFAYVLRFELKTRGLRPEAYILNVSFHIRRFLTKSIEDVKAIKWGHASSIIASLSNPFLNETEEKLLTFTYKQNQHGIQWASEVDLLFSEFFIEEIDPREVLKDPVAYKNREDLKLFVVFNDQTFKQQKHAPEVLAGVGLPERTAFFEDMKKLFANLKPLQLLPEVTKKESLGNKVMPMIHHGEPHKVIQFEIWGSQEFFDKVKEMLTVEEKEDKKILLKNSDEYHFLLNDCNETIIEMVHLDHPEIIAALPQTQTKSEEIRMNEIIKLAPKTEEIRLAMVEIQPAGKYFPKATDPKTVIRQGLGKCNRLTQFAYPISNGSVKHRIQNGFKDLLTDYGYLPHMSKKLERDDLFLSIDLLQIRKGWQRLYIPVMTKLDNLELYVKLFGETEWYLLREALVRTARSGVTSLTKKEADIRRFRSFLKRTMEEELSKTDCNITLIVDATLRSGGWLDITNDQIVSSELPFKHMNETWRNRVRVVRVNATDDYSQYQILKKGKREANRNQGLFYDDHGIYYSIGKRSSTNQKRLALLKYKNPNILITKQNVVELIPLGVQSTEEAADLAEYVHHLRAMVIGYDGSTTLPYPLHMGNKVKKYIEKADVSTWE